MSHSVNEMIKERLYEDIGRLTVDQFQTECNHLQIEDAETQINSIIEQIIQVKMENDGR